MSDDFEAAVQHVLEVEGGYVDHPSDPGGETKYGISKRAYPNLTIATLTRAEAKRIYHRDYWRPLGVDDLDPRLALLAFDAAVNHGLSRAKRWLREHPTFYDYLAHRLRFYARLQTFTAFGRGWVNRMASVLNAASSMRNPIIDADVLYIRRGDGSFDMQQLDPERPARLVGRKLYVNEPRG